MTTGPDTAVNYCYRHPNRQSFILCQRCGRTVCPECQVQAAVGVHCVECAREARQGSERSQRPVFKRAARALAGNSSAPVVSYSIIALTVVVYILQLIPGLGVTNALLYAPAFTQPTSQYDVGFEPWRLLTYAFVHSEFSIGSPFSILHILLNMYSLFIFGRILEPLIGRLRFLALYLITAVGGAVFLDLISPLFVSSGQAVIGASGAIFGLMGAFFVIARKLGGNMQQLIILLVINLAFGFLIPGIAWQVHVGGLIVGALVGLIFVNTRNRRQQPQQIALTTGVAVLLIALVVVRSVV